MFAAASPADEFHLPICLDPSHATLRPRRDAVAESSTSLWDVPLEGVLRLDTLTTGCNPPVANPAPPPAAAQAHYRDLHGHLDLTQCLQSLAQPQLRVVSINCGGLRDKLPGLVRILTFVDPDVALLQEVACVVPAHDLPASFTAWWSPGLQCPMPMARQRCDPPPGGEFELWALLSLSPPVAGYKPMSIGNQHPPLTRG